MFTKNFRILLIIAAVLGLIIIVQNIRSNKGDSTRFATKDTSAITKIEFIKNNKRLYIERKSGKWLIDDQEQANSNAILFLLRIIKNIEVRRIVKKENQTQIIAQIKENNSWMKIYHGENVIKSILIGTASEPSDGTNMMIQNSGEACVIFIPGFAADLSKIFIPRKSLWLDRFIFHFDMRNFKSFEVAYPDNKENTYQIQIDASRKFSVISNGKTFPIANTKVDKLITYISYIQSVNYESGETVNTDSVKLEKNQIVNVFTLQTDENKTTVATLYKRFLKNGEIDNDNVYISINNSSEIYGGKYFAFDALLKDIKYFTE